MEKEKKKIYEFNESQKAILDSIYLKFNLQYYPPLAQVIQTVNCCTVLIQDEMQQQYQQEDMGRPPGAKNKKQNHQLPIATKSAAAAGSVQATAEAVNRFAPPDFAVTDQGHLTVGYRNLISMPFHILFENSAKLIRIIQK
ncbi:MAG: hypothetical protein MHMPM18_001584 [Marteilia pararefringens]